MFSMNGRSIFNPKAPTPERSPSPKPLLHSSDSTATASQSSGLNFQQWRDTAARQAIGLDPNTLASQGYGGYLPEATIRPEDSYSGASARSNNTATSLGKRVADIDVSDASEPRKKARTKSTNAQDRTKSPLKGVSPEDFWAGVDHHLSLDRSNANLATFKTQAPYVLPSGKQVKLNTLKDWNTIANKPESQANKHKIQTAKRLDLLFKLTGQRNKNLLTPETNRIKSLGFSSPQEYLAARKVASAFLQNPQTASKINVDVSKSQLGKFYKGLRDWQPLTKEGKERMAERLGISKARVKLPKLKARTSG